MCLGRVGAILVPFQINPFLVVLGGGVLGNGFLTSWRMGSLGENPYLTVLDLLSWSMVISILLLWDTLLTVKHDPP